jgi:membrane fusion protein, copper/silver efflux system
MRQLTILIISLLLLTSCQQKAPDQHQSNGPIAGTEAFTCPMHPQIVSEKPGKCPVCGMDLVPAKQASDEIMLTDAQIALANIKVENVKLRPIGQSLTVNARVTLDQSRAHVVSSRIAGRIEKLYVEESGVLLKKGQPLFKLFSEQLQTMQEEYVLAVRQFQALGEKEPRYRSFMESTARKLSLYGVSEEQISLLRTSLVVPQTTTFYAAESAYVESVDVVEGQYVGEGTALFSLQDYKNLWLEAELYPSETAMVKRGDQVEVTFDDGRHETAAVIFLSPEFRNGTQISIMRATLKNDELFLRPGMPARVMFTASSKTALTVPVDAVIRDSKGMHVFVVKGNNTFEPRKVRTGVETSAIAEIISGVEDGDTVVVSGAYLLYSELVLKNGTAFESHVH